MLGFMVTCVLLVCLKALLLFIQIHALVQKIFFVHEDFSAMWTGLPTLIESFPLQMQPRKMLRFSKLLKWKAVKFTAPLS